VDAASRTKVEDTRDLLDNVQYAPTRGRYKVYLIDEVHMLSNHSFNALLKTLEEPPPHVKFLLATTDPQKLPVTILSRCLQFNLRRLHPDLITVHLQKILQSEQIQFEAAALTHIARAADGSMRDALSLLDQAIAFGGGQVREEDVKQMLGTIEHAYLYQIIDALAQRDAAALQAAMSDLHLRAPDYDGVLSELLSVLHHIAVLQQIDAAYDESMGDEATLRRLAQTVAPEDVQLFYQIGLTGRRDLPYAPDPVLGFEMTLLRMFAFNIAEPVATAQTGTPQAAPVKTTHTTQASAATATTRPVTAAATKPVPSPVAQAQPVVDEKNWPALIASANLQGMLKQLAMNCSLVKHEDDRYLVAINPSFENLLTKERGLQLQTALGTLLNKKISVEFSVTQVDIETPAMQARREEKDRMDAAQQALEADANVKRIMDTFGATINTESIQPSE